jgi:hydrogenase maturation protease
LTGSRPKILIYGYGNPGRQDDGLGVLLSEELERWCNRLGLDNVRTDSNYQLNLEDASNISDFEIVIFADASREDIPDFRFEPLEPSENAEFSMHAVSPAYVLYLCHQMFNRNMKTYLLHIRGYEWEFMGELTDRARANLEEAGEFIKRFILEACKSPED